jgi:hypothetical protein
MPPVRSVRNQYQGVNAHLHSLWQAVGGWSRFHTHHIADLMRVMRPLLLPMGYDADLEPSIQIRRLDDPSARILTPQSDVTIYDLHPDLSRYRISHPAAGGAETVLALPEALYGERLAEKEYSAIAIYAIQPNSLDRGEPVAWLELLSPSNKPGGRDAQDYFDKRLMLLESGLVFIELDYLHESAPTLKGIASYRRRRGSVVDEDARPYRVIVMDPRPSVEDGIVRVSEFDVDAPFPVVTIPLNGDDVFMLDCGVPYRKTFEETLYGLRLVDYRQLPINFERYSETDQARIANRMLTVLQAAHNLERLDSPLAATMLSLQDALAQIAAFNADNAGSEG